MTTPNLQLIEPPEFSIPVVSAEMRETFRVLDALGAGWMVVISATTTAPPASPPQGATYRVPEGATGAWLGHARHLAIWTQPGWVFRPPRNGWICVVLDQGAPFGAVEEYTGTEWVAWQLPASQIPVSTAGVDFVSTDLADLITEINARFLADEATLSDALVTLADHETRIGVLEAAPGGGGGGGWQNVITQPFSANTTGFSSNGSGSWAISGGVLVQSANNTNGPTFWCNTQIPYAAVRVKCTVKLVSAGAGAAQVTGLWIGPTAPAATPNSSFDLCLRNVSGTKTFTVDKFGGGGTFFNVADAFAMDTFIDLELIISGSRHVVYVDGVAVGSYIVGDANFLTYEYFGVFAYGGAAEFKDFSVDVLDY